MLVKSREDILEFNKYLNLTDEEIGEIAKVAKIISQSEQLSEKAKTAYDKIFSQRKLFNEVSCISGGIEYNAYNGIFWLVVYISGMPNLIERYNKLNISLDIMVDSIKDLVLWVRNFKYRYGYFGIKTYPWLWYSFTGRLFRLGRLEFIPNFFGGNVSVYRSKKTGEVATLCYGGTEIRSDRYVNGTNDVYEKNPSGTVFRYDYNNIVASRADEIGRIMPGLCYLDLDEYECVLRKGDNILEVHIPQGEKMAHDECSKSFEWAKTFFKEHFNYDFKAFTCSSWLLDPQFGELAGKDSNIYKFGKRFTKIPSKCDKGVWKMFVFDKDFGDIKNAPVKTEFQRRVAELVLNGGELKQAYGFILNG